MDLPTFNDAADAVTDTAGNHGRALIPWLPDPPECPECGAMCYAAVTFDPTMAEYVNSWTCKACDAPDRYRDDPDAAAPEPPRRGATALRDVFDQ